ncbi:hypothetical protein ACYF6Y_20665, partial [Citrobacter sp. EBS8]
LSAAQVDRLRDEFGVYLIASGRMCVAGLNHANVQRVAKALNCPTGYPRNAGSSGKNS